MSRRYIISEGYFCTTPASLISKGNTMRIILSISTRIIIIFFLATLSYSLHNESCHARDTDISTLTWNPVHSDQWVATDCLGRELPDHHEVGDIRPNKYIACFYFLWLGRHSNSGPYNNSEILKNHPEARNDPNSPYWGKMGDPHHWGEPLFGYYVGEDEAVLRKHAQMLGDAGVDVICFDVTNQFTYPESYKPLFKVFSEMQKAGNKVPKIAFLCPFGIPNKVVRELWRDVYSCNYYSDIWFYWKGKPLILADPTLLFSSDFSSNGGCVPVHLYPNDKITQRFVADHPFSQITLLSPTWETNENYVNVALYDSNGKIKQKVSKVAIYDNKPYSVSFSSMMPKGTYTVELTYNSGKSVGWWGRKKSEGATLKNCTYVESAVNGEVSDICFLMEIDPEREQIQKFFTFRAPQANYFTGPTQTDQWSWLEVFPQHGFYNTNGQLEEVSVGVAQNAVDGKLSALSHPRSHGRSFHNGKEPAPEDCNYWGQNFQEQWERALELDPEIIFVTGWNEWIASRFGSNSGFYDSPPVTFVDQFDEEFSRDCEPMKGGHQDAYYYQLIANIRRFKGVSPPSQTRACSISIDGKYEDWTNVRPIFYDTISDPVHRHCRGWGQEQFYNNQTGRNDIVESRVSCDNDYLYFYLKVQDQIQGNYSSKDWITLLIDVDENPQTGVNGNDFVVRSSHQEHTLQLCRLSNEGDCPNVSVILPNVEHSISSKELEMKIPINSIFEKIHHKGFRFKWTDGISVLKDWSVFTTDGDAAPNDRYYFRYLMP